MAFSEVPIETHRRDREICPPVADRKVAEVNVSDPFSDVVDEGVGRARITVDQDCLVDKGWRAERFGSLCDPSLCRPFRRELVDRD